MDGLWPGTYKGDALLLAAPRKVCVLGQEPIPRVDAVCTLLPAPGYTCKSILPKNSNEAPTSCETPWYKSSARRAHVTDKLVKGLVSGHMLGQYCMALLVLIHLFWQELNKAS